MGHKTHPIGFRLGTHQDWQARWFAGSAREYRNTLLEDLKLRNAVTRRSPDAGISRIEIERSSQEVTVSIWTARPGIVIGRQGQRVEETRQSLEALTAKKVRISVQEVRQPEIDATLVARNVAEQLERRVSHRRATGQAATRAMQGGARGIKIICRGRLGGGEIARSEKVLIGRVPLHTIRSNIDFAVGEALTMMGRIGVKVWIYKGEIIPSTAASEEQGEELAPIRVTLQAQENEVGEDATAQEG